MRKIFTILAALLLTASVFAQSPEKMSYQAVIRNSSDALVTNTQVGMQISILQGDIYGAAIYVEIQTATTNANGLVSVEIGDGTVLNGVFSSIDWANGSYYIKTETDPAGGTSYTITGTSQLLSVPYALHAKTAKTVTGGITETDPVFVAWDKDYGDLTGTPTTIADYGITDAFDGDYNSLDNSPTLFDGQYSSLTGTPTNVSEFTNDAGYLTGYTETDPSVPTGTQTGEMQYWDGTEWITVSPGTTGQVLTFTGGVPTWATNLGLSAVYNPSTGKTWMDRNLGALAVATKSNDGASFGDLYQWGRGADGHQLRTSGTTSTQSSSDTPGHGDFITPNPDWRSTQNDNLWQGESGVNNPCPSGYRLPTEAEWIAERQSWSSNNADGAFSSPLKLPVAGYRRYSNGSLSSVGSGGLYWSSTVDGTYSRYLSFISSSASMYGFSRALGGSVRCLKD